jgi:hypothetical protein
MADYCRDCQAGLEHCHGTIIEHPLRQTECTEGGCTNTDDVLHAYLLDCGAVGCGCGQSGTLAV